MQLGAKRAASIGEPSEGRRGFGSQGPPTSIRVSPQMTRPFIFFSDGLLPAASPRAAQTGSAT